MVVLARIFISYIITPSCRKVYIFGTTPHAGFTASYTFNKIIKDSRCYEIKYIHRLLRQEICYYYLSIQTLLIFRYINFKVIILTQNFTITKPIDTINR